MRKTTLVKSAILCISSLMVIGLSACAAQTQESSAPETQASSAAESSESTAQTQAESKAEESKATDTAKPDSHDYFSEVTVYEFMARHWDESDFEVRFKEFSEALTQKKDWSDFLVADIAAEYSDPIKTFFAPFEGKEVEYVYTKCPRLYKVEGFDEYNDMRGILEYKFRVKDGDAVTEYSTMFNIARHGDASGMKWQIYQMMWKDTGVDVSEAPIKQLDPPAKGEEVCIMTTDAGVIKMRLFPDEAPIAVKNWIELSKQGFYDGTPFARVIKNFVIQGGALDGSGDESKSIYGGFFEDEVGKGLYNFNGALCLGNVGPHTNGNQFYIVQCPTVDEARLPLMSLPVNIEEKYKEIGGFPELDGRYTVYGQVYEGMDVVEAIAAQETDDQDAPLSNPVKVVSITFETIE